MNQVAGSVAVEIRGDLGNLEGSLSRAKTSAERFDASMDGLKQSVDALRSSVDALQKSAQEITAGLGRLGQGTKAVDAGMDQAGTSAAAFDTKLDDLRKSVDESKRAIDNLSKASKDTNLDSAQVDAKRLDRTLDDLAASARDVRAQIDPLGAAIERETRFIQEATRLTQANVLTQRELGDVMNLSKARLAAMGQSYKGLSFEAKNLSYQLVDVTQGLVSGAPVYQIFAQQAGQIGQVIASSPSGLGGLMKELGSSIAGLLTPTRLAGVGLAVLAAGAYMAYSSWKGFALALDDVARAADETSSEMAKLQATAAFKGIGQDSFVQASGQFATNLYQAKNNMGSLAELLHANGKSATDFSGTLGTVADLIARAKGDTQLQFAIMRQAGIPTTMEWLRYLEQGSEGIKKAKDSAAEFGGAANDNLIKKAREFDEAWNRVWTNFGLNMRGAIGETLSLIDRLIDKSSSMMSTIGNASIWSKISGPVDAKKLKELGLEEANKFDDVFSSAGGNASNPALQQALETRAKQMRGDPAPIDFAAQRQAIQLTLQRIQALGQLATVDQQVQAAELQLRLQRMQPGNQISDVDVKRVVDFTRAQAEWTQVAGQAQVGVFRLGEAQKYAGDQMAAWISQGLVDPRNAQEMAAAHQVLADRIRETGNQAAVAASPLKQLKQLEIDASSVTKQLDAFGASTLNNLSSSLVGIATGATSASEGFKNFGLSVVKALEEMIIKLTIIGPLAKILGGASGLGLLGGLFSGGGTFGAGSSAYALGGTFGAPVPFASGSAFANQVYNSPTLFRFASGGAMRSGVMGEAGPEAVMPLKRTPGGKLGVMVAGGSMSSGGGAPVAVNMNYAPTFYNADPATRAQIMAETRRDLAAAEKRIYTNIPRLRENQPGYLS